MCFRLVSQPGDGTFNHEKLLRSLKSSTLRENVREVLISPERLELGDLLGRGTCQAVRYIQTLLNNTLLEIL